MQPDALLALLDATASAPAAAPTRAARASPIRFERVPAFLKKSAILLVTTLAFVPVLASRSTIGAGLYLGLLLAVHVAGLFVVLAGIRRGELAFDRRGVALRVAAVVVVLALLGLAAKGVEGPMDAVFWLSLLAIWLLHTAGLALLHLRGARDAGCPFV